MANGNIFFNGAVLAMSSGWNGSSLAPMDRVQSVGISFQPPRTTTSVLGRFKPLNDRPVINFTPANLSVDFIKSSKNFESNLGLLNTTGIGLNLADSNNVQGFGLRDFEILMASTKSTSYSNQLTVRSGALTSYTIQGSVGDPVRGSCSFECLDYYHEANSDSKVAQNYSGELIKSENISISGIQFDGFGLSGLMVQSFNLSISVNRSSTFRLGKKYPERNITDISANLQLNGFVEGIDSTFVGPSGFDCGAPITGAYYLTLQPSCSDATPTTYTLTNPYLESYNFGASVGNFTNVDLSFSLPISILSNEVSSGPNLTIT